MIDDRILERIKKLQALAERGVGGEKATAEKKLKKLLSDNNITEADLQTETINYYLFSYQGEHQQKLLSQIIYKILGQEFKLYKSKGTRNKIGTYCTAAQKVEIDLDFEFYNNLFQEEIDLLLSAFIKKQSLFPEDAPTIRLDPKELSKEELDRLNKVDSLASQIDARKRAAALISERED